MRPETAGGRSSASVTPGIQAGSAVAPCMCSSRGTAWISQISATALQLRGAPESIVVIHIIDVFLEGHNSPQFITADVPRTTRVRVGLTGDQLHQSHDFVMVP